MKIYFAGSIRGGREDAKTYFELIQHLKKYGEVLTEHVGSPDLTNQGEDLPLKTIHDRDVKWLLSADVLIADISTPSVGVGYEIGRAIENRIKTLCLHSEEKGERVSGIIRGCSDLQSFQYPNIEEAKKIIDNFLAA